ncbi:hypothetical protein VTO42DRAFT_6781 [Malbranchea cinnamomea]
MVRSMFPHCGKHSLTKSAVRKRFSSTDDVTLAFAADKHHSAERAASPDTAHQRSSNRACRTAATIRRNLRVFASCD